MTLRELTVEHVVPISHSAVHVTTVELWNVRVLDAESGELLRESRAQSNRVRYQLKRTSDGWLVVSRTI